MTREQYDKLLSYEQHLRWAVKSNFVHMSNREFGALALLYKDIYGETLTQNQMTCNTCRLRALTKMGQDYFAIKEQIAQEEKEERLKQVDKTEEESKPKDKKKAGRKPKIDIN